MTMGTIGKRFPRKHLPAMLLVLVFVVVTAGIISAGYLYFQRYEQRYRLEVEHTLQAIADLKAERLSDWRRERLGDAAVYFDNPVFSRLAQRFLEGPAEPAARELLEAWLGRLPTAYAEHYDRVFLYDLEGVERFASPKNEEPPALHLREDLAKALKEGRVLFLDYHRDAEDLPIHLSVLVPIFADEAPARPLGALVFRIDPANYLYPFIVQWPMPSQTGETLLVRREGDEVVFLNELRFRKQTALALRFPLTRTQMPAVQAARGFEGIMDGVDYRGVPVVACVRAVPDSPWFIVARMDISEVDAPLRERLLKVALAVAGLLLGAAASVGLVWRNQRAHYYRARLEASEALRALSSRQEALLAAVPDIIMEVDRNKVYTWANRAGLDFFGEDVVGKEAAFYFEGEQETYKSVKPLFNGQENVIYVESWQRRRDGEVRLLAWWCRVLKDKDGRVTGALSSARDITEKKRTEEALVIQKRIGEIFLTISDDAMYFEVLKIVLEVLGSPFGVFGYIDEAGALVVPSMTRDIWDQCRVPQKEIVFPREEWGDSSWPRAVREKKANFSNRPSDQVPPGHVPIMRHICLPILFNNEVIGLFEVANRETDYTHEDIRKLEEIAVFVAPALSARRQRQRHERELQEKNDELIRFTYTVSHDLKSPLVTIRTFLGYLERDARKEDGEAAKKDLDYIRNAVDKMSKLLDELLELSRIGRKMNPPQEAPLQEIVKEALELVAGRIAAEGVKVEVTQEPLFLYGDRPRLVEVFQNLVDNAVKFMGDQPEPRIEIGAEPSPEGREIVLFVRDNGMGIDPAYQPKLFGLFEKLDSGTEGTGIGLALVKRIVEVHGGRIWVGSEGPGKGSAFRFTLARTRRQPSNNPGKEDKP